MITVQKQNIADWIVVGYLADLHTVTEKLRYLEQKYSQTWDEFSKQIKESSSENFNRWDDYIEWKAYVKTDKDLKFKIEEVRRGNFEIA